MTLNDKQPKTPGERFLWWAKGVSALALASIAVYAALTGNEAKDNVDSTWDALQAKVDKQSVVINKQSETVEKLTRRMVFFQGWQAGFSSGKLYEQNETLQKQLEELKAKKIPRSADRKLIVEILRGKRVESRKPKAQPKATSKPFQKIDPLPDRPYKK